MLEFTRTDEIKANLLQVRGRIERAARAAGRDHNEICLIAVSKKKTIEAVRSALLAGQTDFGENYVQEGTGKITVLADQAPRARWHFIGVLQTNKARQAVGKFALIHSVDREKLLATVNAEALRLGIVQDILIEVNVAGEASKGGATPTAARELVGYSENLPGVRVRGLMTMPPLTDNPELNRAYFGQIREWLREWRGRLSSEDKRRDFCELSMGTSGDFEVAISEGATMVRVGTAIFGARD